MPALTRATAAGMRRSIPAPALLACAMLAGGPAAAADYPAKPIRIVLPNAAGASTDTIARILASKLTELAGQQVIIDNRPGGGGIIGMEAVKVAAPDGYTLAQCGVSQAIRPALYRSLPFDTVRDFARVAQYGAVANVLVVHPSLPARTLKEFVAHVKASPGRIDYASSGIGFSPHLTMEYFKTTAGIDMVHVPYKSAAQANADVLGGQMKVAFNNVPSQLPNIKSGKLRGLAVTSARRSAELPDVPTIAESGYPGFEVTVWYGICAPAKTPRPVISRLESIVVKALAAPDLQQKFAAHGVAPRVLAGADFDRYFQSEVARWAKVVRNAGIKPE
ncbi:MAG: tripartite tricarboxylate transporter substrate binding protein [Burkholderiales bacterium]|nr:tripartite tricarboxylate transporter substrate binding protein [Burkholderiales bacterium]